MGLTAAHLQLSAVAAISARSAWAVGVTNRRRPLIERWDGETWSRVASPDPGPAGAFVPLQGVSALSARDAWAVGEVAVGGHTLIVHWNGKAWTRVPSPSPSAGGNVLNAVAAASSSSAWAAGYSGNQTLVMHWDGKTWAQVPAPSPGDEPEFLGVTATADSAWAVGLDGSDDTLIAQRNGATWTRQPDRHPS